MPNSSAKKTRERNLSFIQAVKNNDFDRMTYLLNKGVDINLIFNDDDFSELPAHSALHRAVLLEYEKLIKFLITKGANVNLKNDGLDPPLAYAIERNPNIIQLLLNHNANVNLKKTENDKTMFALVAAEKSDEKFNLMLSHCIEKKIEIKLDWQLIIKLIHEFKKRAAALLTNKIDLNIQFNHPTKRGKVSLLLYAIIENDFATAKFLLEAGAKVNVEINFETNLHAAILENSVQMVQLLLEYGADPNIKCLGQTALHCAVQQNNLELVSLLLKQNNIHVDATSNEEETALYVAVKLANLDMINLLLGHKADPNKANIHSNTPLMKACHQGHKQIVEILLKNGANINQVSETDSFVLLEAVLKDNYEMVQLLLKNNADVNLKNPNGETALWYIARKGFAQTNILILLFSQNADMTVKSKNDNSCIQQLFSDPKKDAAIKSIFFYEALVRQDIVSLDQMLTKYKYEPSLSGLTVYLYQRQLSEQTLLEAIKFVDTLVSGKVIKDPIFSEEIKNILRVIGLKQEDPKRKHIPQEHEKVLKELEILKKLVATLMEENAATDSKLIALEKKLIQQDKLNPKLERSQSATTPRLFGSR